MKTNRRRFLRWAGISGMSAMLSGCIPQTPRLTPLVTPTSTNNVTPTQLPQALATSTILIPKPSPTLEPKIMINGGDAEVWAWSKQVYGRLQNLTCSAIQVQAGNHSETALIEDNRFKASMPLAPGDNRVQAFCQNTGNASLDKTNITSEAHIYTVGLRDVPTSNIAISIQHNSGATDVLLDGNSSQPSPYSQSPIVQYRWIARAGNPAALKVANPVGKSLAEVNTANLLLTLPEAEGEYYLSLTVTDQAGKSDTSTTYFVVRGGQPQLDDWSWQNTAWVENAIVYGVIPRNFGNHGFQSIADRLDDLQNLGVNAIWLAPVNTSPAGDYGYAVMDYFNLNPKYGTKEDFRRMVQAAHQRGIRVLMDFVPNHSSIKHPYFEDTIKYGQDSHYWMFYDRDETGAPTHYFDWAKLPNLNYSNPEVETWITEAFAYWVREFDVDGFRVDACWGVKERKPDYWPRWRQALKRIKPDLLLLAEASARDPYYFTNGFDAAYDWTDQVGHWAWDLVFPKQPLLIYNLDMALTNAGQGFHQDALIFRFLNNNDTGERFITKFGLEMTRVATVLLMTLPGIPCIYTGDEVGAEFTPYGDPQPIAWDDPNNLRDFHKQLIQLRKTIPALHSRQWQILNVEPHKQVYAYMRYTAGKEDMPALVLLNFSPDPVSATLEIPQEFSKLYQRSHMHDLLSGEVLTAGGSAIKIKMPAQTGRIIMG